ncbi:MAG TPA: (Fe-S)-binding protein [Euryarchaeota archaeon]|nr:(Fe-S)-binding protein [Euryarchaeota archaeon]
MLEDCSRCHCGCCKDGCPIYNTLFEEQVSARGRNLIIRAYLKGVIEADERLVRTVYSCLLCRLDEENCGARIPCAEIYENMRAHLVEKGVGPLPEHEALTASLRNYGNPWMQPKTAREKWIKRSKLPLKEEGEGAKSLYYSGCTFPLDPSIQSVPLAVAKLFRLAGEKFALLGKDEVCCGSTSLRIGERKLFEELRQNNMEKLKQYERVITSCAGCYKTMSQDYPDSDGKPEILHSLQVLRDLLKWGKLKPSETKVRVTYHDPCHLGRHSGMYDIPREIINSIPGVELVEMRNSRELARCCGSGAGVKTANPEVSLEIAKRRVEEACETGAEILLSACPFCEQGLIDATKAMKKKIKVMDIAELLLEACD